MSDYAVTRMLYNSDVNDVHLQHINHSRVGLTASYNMMLPVQVKCVLVNCFSQSNFHAEKRGIGLKMAKEDYYPVRQSADLEFP